MVEQALIGPDVPAHAERRIRLADGRVLAVAEWGDPEGRPLFALHGTPGGRISYWHDPSIYARHGLRRFTLDRPGYGESTRKPGRRVADIAADVAAVADELGLDRFAVTGGSGGGPHALACAALLPDRVTACLVEAAVAPADAPGLDWTAGMTDGNVEEFEAARAGEGAIRALAERERAVMFERISQQDVNVLGDDYEVSESDRVQLARHFWQFANHVRSALGGGVDGWVDDDLAFVVPWGFDVTAIRVPLCIKYGRADTLVPPSHGDWLAAHLPAATVVTEDVGHLGDDATYETELAWLANWT